MKRTIGIIGFGNMGSAIARRVKNYYGVWVFDKDTAKTGNIAKVKVAGNIGEVVNNTRALILAVKPQDFKDALPKIKPAIDKKLVISIAAGIKTKFIEKHLGKIGVIRAMPNLPIKIGKGMICLCKGKYATKKDLKSAEKIFSHLGKTMIIPRECLMDAVTAISGSGPGFFYYLLTQNKKKNIKDWLGYSSRKFQSELTGSAKALGFSSRQAKQLASKTAMGSIALLRATKMSPETLCKQVTSKNGTTEAGLEKLKNGFSLSEAVQAAVKRAKELSKKE